jgi:hypothetical protein
VNEPAVAVEFGEFAGVFLYVKFTDDLQYAGVGITVVSK